MRLTVTDNQGATASVTNPVTITAPAPTVPAAPAGVSATNDVGTSPASAASSPVTPAANPSIVVNGGFESGLASWTAGGVAAPKPAATAHTGTGSALLGIASGSEPLGDSTLSQSVAVPFTGTSSLSFWYQPHTADAVCGGKNRKPCKWDWMEGQVRSSNGNTLATLFKLNNNSGTWTHVTADLTAFRGQTVTLWFNVHLDGAIPADDTWMYLDDVTVTNG